MSEMTTKGPRESSTPPAQGTESAISAERRNTHDVSLNGSLSQSTFDWAEPLPPFTLTQQDVTKRWADGRSLPIGTTIDWTESPVTGPIQGSIQITVTGPAEFGPTSFLRSLIPGSSPPWNRVTFELKVGSADCPSWEDANRTLLGVTHLIELADGLVTNKVVQAIRENLHVLETETFRGPPRDE